QLVQRHHFQFGLSGGGGRLEHAAIIKKRSPRRAGAWGFVSSLTPLSGRFCFLVPTVAIAQPLLGLRGPRRHELRTIFVETGAKLLPEICASERCGNRILSKISARFFS
ncbi:MAG: hypothetical protein PHI64_05340, partial [Zoogloea sp.]|uniref:hypothetical protein n=1 Tax=Zoogloea sp. TaxID=49181 RepID=UPI0026296CF4